MARWLRTLEPERAHAQRVAAWAWLIARKLKLDAGAAGVLEQAARIHHEPGTEWSGDGAGRLLCEVREGQAGWRELPPARVDTAEALAAALRHACAQAGRREVPVLRLLRILEAAHAFDECLEALPYEARDLPGLLEEAAALAPDREWAALMAVFQKHTKFDDRKLDAAMRRLPVNPQVVVEAARVVLDPNAEPADLERLAGRDPALAAGLLQAANSAQFARRRALGTLRQAIVHLGTDQSRRVLSAVALRGAFRAPGARPLWVHSLDTAAMAAEIAGQVVGLDPREAFLCGLLHDLGRLLLLASTEGALQPYSELTARGCPPVAVELALCGRDHAEIGARALERWGIAASVVEAVRAHHQPGAGAAPLAAVLQVCEEVSGMDEDLPSVPRLRDSLVALGLKLEEFRGAPAPGLTALRDAP
jgi:putative nucleotidyltransferase with HDIG domain